jgi:hypothetical protein
MAVFSLSQGKPPAVSADGKLRALKLKKVAQHEILVLECLYRVNAHVITHT